MPEDEKYEVLEKIGHGSFGIIRKVQRKSDGYILCRKEISYSKMSQKEREQLQAELSILKELRHPNIVAYYERDHIKLSQDLHLYMEYCGNGDLGRVIRDLKHNNQLAEEEFVWSMISQIVSALYRCHNGEDPPAAGRNVMGLGADAKPASRSKPMILHRDLKPENIFLDHDNSVKLGDFGLSKILQSHDFASTYVGTPFYMSPEICKAEQYTHHSDIWALGCIIYELCAKQPPFNAKTHFELIQKIKLGNYPPIPSCYSGELNKVIASCLQVQPNRRPDTVSLLNLPIVKLMRKEQEVVRLGHSLRQEKERYSAVTREAEEMKTRYQRMCEELDGRLRREWEVKARLEIDHQVKALRAVDLANLQAQFEVEVARRVQEALKKHPNLESTSPRLAPRSSTPTQPAEQQILFPSEPTESVGTTSVTTSTGTLGTDSSFASGTDISSLSLSDTVEELTQKPAVAPAKRPARQPLSRARTMFAAPAPASPMDIQMAEPSPAPASLAGLSLSPRRNAPRQNIFAAAKNGAKKWEAEIPPSPTDNEWAGDFDDDDDLPVLPSPTRARSASGSRTNANSDPFKALNAAHRPLLKPNQRLASAPSLAPTGSRQRPASAVPIVATSPTRQTKTRSVDLSPTRKGTSLTSKLAENNSNSGGGLKSKKGNEQIRIQAMRNNGITGRTILELNRKERNPIVQQAMSEDEGRKLRTGIRSPMKARSANALDTPAVWDPEVVEEMPSPFIQRSKKMIK